MKNKLFGMIALLAIGCTIAPADVMENNALPKTPDADTASRVMGVHGCGPLGNGKVE